MSHRHRHGPSGPSPFVLEEARHVVRMEEEQVEHAEMLTFELMGSCFAVGALTHLLDLFIAVRYSGDSMDEWKANMAKDIILMIANGGLAWYWMRRIRQL